MPRRGQEKIHGNRRDLFGNLRCFPPSGAAGFRFQVNDAQQAARRIQLASVVALVIASGPASVMAEGGRINA